jgi:hypothetical protein
VRSTKRITWSASKSGALRARATPVVPAHVRVPEEAQHSPPPDTVIDVRAVRAARPVGECEMLAVIGHP